MEWSTTNNSIDGVCATCTQINDCEVLNAMDGSGGVDVMNFSCSEYIGDDKFRISRPDLD